MADDFAAEKERDFINAKEARRMLAGRLAEAKYAQGLSCCKICPSGDVQNKHDFINAKEACRMLAGRLAEAKYALVSPDAAVTILLLEQ